MSSVQLAGQRPAVKLGSARGREELRAWVPDDRLGTFVVGVAGRPVRRDELWKMRILHQLDDLPAAAVEAPPVRPPSAIPWTSGPLCVRNHQRQMSTAAFCDECPVAGRMKVCGAWHLGRGHMP